MADAVHGTRVSSSQTATGLPEVDRRAFLHGLRRLSALPLIGGSIALIGAPRAVAEPVTDQLVQSYKCWLHYEHRLLCCEMAGFDDKLAQQLERSFWTGNEGANWHFGSAAMQGGWKTAPQPSTRAALVLSAVGCDWRHSNG
jgi:hypothetical protein